MRYLLIASLLLFCSCRQQYPEPVSTIADQEPLVYRTIAELKTMMGNGNYEIRANLLITGIVIADDRSGNFYKQVIIDDGSAALPVLIDAYNLFNDYPLGRKISIRCKGLSADLYNKLPQLGFRLDPNGSLTPIPWLLLDLHIQKGSCGHSIDPIRVSLAEAATTKQELLNRLIRLSGVQIRDTAGRPSYALDPDIASATNIVLSDCEGHTITMRNSGYCGFRSALLPAGNGSVTAIYSVYGNTPQLIIRDTADLDCIHPRCP